MKKLTTYVKADKVGNVLTIMAVKCLVAGIASFFLPLFLGMRGNSLTGAFPRVLVFLIFYALGTIFVFLLRLRNSVVNSTVVILAASIGVGYAVNWLAGQNPLQMVIYGVALFPVILMLVVTDFVRISRIRNGQ